MGSGHHVGYNCVRVRDMSRLVSRIRYRQFGVRFTTSCRRAGIQRSAIYYGPTRCRCLPVRRPPLPSPPGSTPAPAPQPTAGSPASLAPGCPRRLALRFKVPHGQRQSEPRRQPTTSPVAGNPLSYRERVTGGPHPQHDRAGHHNTLMDVLSGWGCSAAWSPQATHSPRNERAFVRREPGIRSRR
jgi:hypothetical protein